MSTRKRIIEKLDYLNQLNTFLNEASEDVLLLFDSRSVQRMIKGVDYIYKDSKRTIFSNDAFNDEEFLVCCLASCNHLGAKITMLPFHLEEFGNHFQMGFGLEDRGDFTPQHLKRYIRDTSTETRRRSVKTSVDISAKNCTSQFKVAASACDVGWRARARRLIMIDNVLELKPAQWNFEQIDQIEYATLLTEFELRRPRHPKNNRNDALALCCLIQLVDSFNQGNLKAMPIFYDGSGYISQVLEGTGLSRRFFLNVGDESVSCIRPSKYFLLRALFSMSTSKEISSLEQSFSDIQLSTNDLLVQYDNLKNSGDIFSLIDFNDELEKFINYEFLKKIMLVEFQTDRLASVFSQMNLRLEDYQSKEFRAELDSDIEEIRLELSKAVRAAQFTHELWEAIQSGTITLKERIPSTLNFKNKPLNVESDFGLIRFSFSRSVASRIEHLFGTNGLLSSSPNDALCHSAQIQILTQLISEFAKEDNNENPITNQEREARKRQNNNFIAGLAVLWIFKRYDLITRLIKNHHVESDFSIALLKTASFLFQNLGQSEEAQTLIVGLQQEANNSSKFRAQIQLGLAYIYFYNCAIEERFTVNNAVSSNISQTALLCLTMAKEALQSYQESTSINTAHAMSKIYALNVFVFCGTELGGNDFFKNEVVTKAKVLNNYRETNQLVWQYRFDDTLARYHQRLALQTRSAFEPNIDQAIDYAKSALTHAIDDQQVLKNYLRELITLKANYENQSS